MQARALNDRLFPLTDERPWALPHFQAAVRAWWLAQYSGFYLEEPPEAAIPPGTDLDEGMMKLPLLVLANLLIII